MSEEKKMLPELRFPGFTDLWESRKLENLMDFSNGINAPKENYGKGRKMISVMDVLSFGELSYENIRNSVEVDSTVEERYKVENGDIVFARSSEIPEEVGWAKAYTDNKYALYSGFAIRGKKKSEYDSIFIERSLNGVGRKQIERKAGGSTRFNVSQGILNSIDIMMPNYKEQTQIGSFLKQLDNLIILHQRKLEHLQTRKKGLLQKMFPKAGNSVPELRFPGFTDAWEQRKLGELMSVASVKRIHQSDWTDSGIRFLRARDIVSASKNEEPADYLYISEEKYNEYSAISGKVSPGDMLVTGVGTIGVPMLILDDKPLYFKDGNIIWFKNEKQINGKFFYYSFTGKQIQDFIHESAGIGTVGTYTIESGKKTPISLPSNTEQKKIGIFFHNLDNLITLHQRKLEHLQTRKKALLQQMFV